MKDSYFKEHRSEKSIFRLYDISKIPLEIGDKDYSNVIIGDYIVLYPIVAFVGLNVRPYRGWVCKNINNGYYKVILKNTLVRYYGKIYNNSYYFGIGYVSKDLLYSKLSEVQFKEELLNEILKNYGKIDEELVEILCNNLKINLQYFKNLEKDEFEIELMRIVNKYHFEEIKDVSSYKDCLYILVIDEYKQFYVGKTVRELKKRVNDHWRAKIITERQIFDGGNEYSRIKVDNFQMFDTTRIFVCPDYKKIINENIEFANNKKIEKTNTFGYEDFYDMNDLSKAERIVIDNCKCKFCLSDRTALLGCNKYIDLEKKYFTPKDDLLIMNYLNIDL